MFIAFFVSPPTLFAQAQLQTYCNPMNIDYAYSPIPNFSAQGNHRTTADPVITLFKGDYYLFSTNQWGYWWSEDMLQWTFVPRRFLKPWHKVYDDLCAPATLVLGDTLLLLGSAHTFDFPIWMSTNPRVGERKELILPHGDVNGWERFGEYNDNTFLAPFVEGAWMNKHNGKYYLHYGAPGTEFSGYGDGAYVGEQPLGPFTYQNHNPFSFKPGGFARGAGHGSTFQDKEGNWWHVATLAISVKNNFERRIGIFPTAFDDDGVLHTNTTYGDYPHYVRTSQGNRREDYFAGWMLLNYNKPVIASSTYGGHEPNFAVDEEIKTYWSAGSGNSGEWFQTDLGSIDTVRAIQINYADQDAEFLGKQRGIYHQYILSSSLLFSD
jgi:hypothetical protein